jgi:hypothetical protein
MVQKPRQEAAPTRHTTPVSISSVTDFPEMVPEAPPESKPRLDNVDAARTWALADPARALLWLPCAPAGEVRDAVLEIACAEVAQFDPAWAITLADRYGPTNVNLRENLVQQWAEVDEAAAANYASRRPAGEEHDRLLSRVALTLARSRPLDAARLVASQITPGFIQTEAAISVLNQWGQQDHQGAMRWAQSFPAGEVRSRAIAELTRSESTNRPMTGS